MNWRKESNWRTMKKEVDGMGETKLYIINKMGVDKMTHVHVTKGS